MIAKDKAAVMNASSKLYNAYTEMYGVTEKTWNDGNGSLGLYKFSDGDKVTANTCLETKADRKKLLALFPDAIVLEYELGYPEYYSTSLPHPDNMPQVEIANG